MSITNTCTVDISGAELPSDMMALLTSAYVDDSQRLPDMFELTFHDPEGTVIDDAGVSIGDTIEVKGGKAGSTDSTSLIKGEVTAIEAICAEGEMLSIIRGYERAHRLQRARRTRTFVGMTDSDIASQIASDAGLDTDDIDDTDTEPHLLEMDSREV